MPGIQINSLQDILMLRELKNQANPTYSAMKALADGVAGGIAEEQKRKIKKRNNVDIQAQIMQLNETPNTISSKIGGFTAVQKPSIDKDGNLEIGIDFEKNKPIKPSQAQIEAARAGIPIPREGDDGTDIPSGDFGLLNQIAERNRQQDEAEAQAGQQKIAIAEQARVAKTVNDIDDDIRSTKSIIDFGTIERSGANIQSAYERAIKEGTTSKNAPDQALVVSFNKMLDPGSVVRESEYARTPAGEAFFKQVEGRFRQLTTGGAGLTDSSRKEILLMTQDLVNNAREFAKRDIQVFRKRAEAFNVPVDLLYGGFLKEESFNTPEEADSSGLPSGTIVDVGGRRYQI